MQDYYNYTTKYQWGGKFITKFLGQGLRNARTLLNDSKIVPRLNGLSRSFEVVDANFSKQLKELSNLIKTHRVSTKPTNSPEVVSQLKRIQEYFNHNKNLPELRSKINKQTFTGRQSNLRGTPLGTSQPTSATQSATQSARSPYLNGSNLSYTVPPSPRASKMRNARNRKAAQQNQAQNQAQGNPSKEVASANPVPGTTLSSRWQQAKQWMNNHPKTVVGGALFLGSGTGRDILSKVGQLYNVRPFTSSSATDQQIVTINGVDIPITKSSNGKFVPVSAQKDNSSPTPTNAGDDIDALINNANGETETSDTIQGPSQVPGQQTINDLFVDDQDQWY